MQPEATQQARQEHRTPITVEDLTKKAEASIQFAGETIADLHGMPSADFIAFANAQVMNQIPQNGATYPTDGFASAPYFGGLSNPFVAMQTITRQDLDAPAVIALASVRSKVDRPVIDLMPAVTVTRFENENPSFILAQLATDGGKPLDLSEVASLRVNVPNSRPVARFDEIVQTSSVLVLGATHRDHPNLFLLIEEGGKGVRWISPEEITPECTVFSFEKTGTGNSEES